MSALKWDDLSSRIYESGLDRGVIYYQNQAASWSGLVSVEGSNNTTMKEYFIDGFRYYSRGLPGDWSGSLEAFMYPDLLDELIGNPRLEDGLQIESQNTIPFGLSYRTMTTAPTDSEQHYKIHLIYGVTAVLDTVSYATLSSDSTDPSLMKFNLNAIPQNITGARASAKITLDTRKIDKDILNEIESTLYGSPFKEPSMPPIQYLRDVMSFGDTIVITRTGNYTWEARGSSKNIIITPDGYFTMHNAEAEFIDSNTYRFLGTDEEKSPFFLKEDEDGSIYYNVGPENSNVGIDTDGSPYYETSKNDYDIDQDSDGTPYLKDV